MSMKEAIRFVGTVLYHTKERFLLIMEMGDSQWSQFFQDKQGLSLDVLFTTELEQKKKLKAMELKLKNVEFKQLKDSRKNEKLNEEYKKPLLA